MKAGTDGLKIINKLISKSKKLLKNNGKLIFEIGDNQESFVNEKQVLHKQGLRPSINFKSNNINKIDIMNNYRNNNRKNHFKPNGDEILEEG